MNRFLTFSPSNPFNSDTGASSKPILCLTFIPEQCPQCRKIIRPQVTSCFYTEEEKNLKYSVVFQCPDCQCVFIAVYSSPSLPPINISPHIVQARPSFDSITELSPGFVEQYNQAATIEAIGLPDAAGMIYRKAFEFLIKDYLIKVNPDKAEIIRTKLLGNCIRDHITDCPDLRTVAERAAWLGNDFAHYTRKYSEYDVHDMKEIIEIAQYWISMKIRTATVAQMDRR